MRIRRTVSWAGDVSYGRPIYAQEADMQNRAVARGPAAHLFHDILSRYRLFDVYVIPRWIMDSDE